MEIVEFKPSRLQQLVASIQSLLAINSGESVDLQDRVPSRYAVKLLT
jgi:hypothetical protein